MLKPPELLSQYNFVECQAAIKVGVKKVKKVSRMKVLEEGVVAFLAHKNEIPLKRFLFPRDFDFSGRRIWFL